MDSLPTFDCRGWHYVFQCYSPWQRWPASPLTRKHNGRGPRITVSMNSGSWWWTGRPGVLRFMGSQRVGHDWATELNWTKRRYCTLGQEKALCIPTAMKLGDGERIELAKPLRMETVGWLWTNVEMQTKLPHGIWRPNWEFWFPIKQGIMIQTTSNSQPKLIKLGARCKERDAQSQEETYPQNFWERQWI